MSLRDHDNLRGPTENPMGPQVVPFLKTGGGQEVQRRHIPDKPNPYCRVVGPEEVERHRAKENNGLLIGRGQEVQRGHITDNPNPYFRVVGPEEAERHRAKANNGLLIGRGQEVQRGHITDNPNPYFRVVGPEEAERHRAKVNNGLLIGPNITCGSAPAFWSGFVSRGYRSEGRCLICSLDEHTSSECPYQAELPKNAIVGRSCDIICKVCPSRIRVGFPGCCCNRDSLRAELKFCVLCKKLGEHWPDHCPELNSGLWGPLMG